MPEKNGFGYNVEGFDMKNFGTEQPGGRADQLRKFGAQSGAPGLAAQGNALQMMQMTAEGKGPSVAQQQMASQQNRNMAQSMAMAGASRGGNLAGMQQQAMGAHAGMSAQNTRDMSLLRAQEQLGAQQAYAGQANAMAGQQMGYEQLAQQGVIAGGQQNIDWRLGKGQLDLQKEQLRLQKNKMWADAIIGGVSAVGSFIGSDPVLKTGIQPTSAAGAAAELAPVEYDYRPGAGPPGHQIGLDASQVAQTSLGSTLVGQAPDGTLQLDGARAGVAGLAASGENTRRIAALEQQLMAGGGGGGDNFGTAEAGATREREAQRMSNDIAMARGRGQQQRAMTPTEQPYNFQGAPQMSRFHQGQTIDPFSEGFQASGSKMLDRLRSEHFPEIEESGLAGKLKEMGSSLGAGGYRQGSIMGNATGRVAGGESTTGFRPGSILDQAALKDVTNDSAITRAGGTEVGGFQKPKGGLAGMFGGGGGGGGFF
jgi:hypothetical protein